MVEKLRFEGVEHIVEVDFNKPHSSHRAATYAFDEHRPVVFVESKDGLSAHEVVAKLGQHRFSCKELLNNEGKTKGY